MKTSKMVTLCVVLFSVISASRQQGDEVEDQTEFSYKIGSPNGPERWGFLKPEWAECKDGNMQSPIELPWDPQVRLPRLSEKVFYSYNSADAVIRNRGHDIEVWSILRKVPWHAWPEGASKIRINNTEYILKQCHFHTPSEHTIGDSRYAMELHMVHESAYPFSDYPIAVVGFLYVIGDPNPFLSKLSDKINQLSDTNREIPAGKVDPTIPIDGRARQYFRYVGSLTTPPCSEPVLWTVDAELGTVSQEQIDMLHKIVHDDAKENARPLQPSNGRDVVLFDDFLPG